MQDVKLDTLCVTDEELLFTGLIAVKDIANANMSFRAKPALRPSYENIVSYACGHHGSW